MGKGHKKFSFPLLKPSGAYKKPQLVGWDGWQHLLAAQLFLAPHGNVVAPEVSQPGTGLPWEQGAGQTHTPLTAHPSCCEEGAPASTSFHFLSEPELLYEVPVPSGTPAPARVPSGSPQEG